MVRREESEVKEFVPLGFFLQVMRDAYLSQTWVFVPIMLSGFW